MSVATTSLAPTTSCRWVGYSAALVGSRSTRKVVPECILHDGGVRRGQVIDPFRKAVQLARREAGGELRLLLVERRSPSRIVGRFQGNADDAEQIISTAGALLRRHLGRKRGMQQPPIFNHRLAKRFDHRIAKERPQRRYIANRVMGAVLAKIG